MQLGELLENWAERFATAGIESAEADAQLLAGFLTGRSRGEIQSAVLVGESLEPEFVEQYEAFAVRREAREPLQHLTGVAHFRQIELQVGKGVFVPRPETELIAGLGIEFAVKLEKEHPVVVDLGTGSGAIALSVAREVPNATVFAVEKSADSLAWAEKNFDRFANAEVRLGDLTDAFNELNGSVDVVLTNPPYIPVDMVPVYPEVVLHDPGLALYGGQDGLDVIRLAERTAKRLLRDGGFFAVEHADIQAAAITELLLAAGWHNVISHQDFNGRDRVVTAIR
jgi:release factor glutamine methyltransferase